MNKNIVLDRIKETKMVCLYTFFSFDEDDDINKSLVEIEETIEEIRGLTGLDFGIAPITIDDSLGKQACELLLKGLEVQDSSN
ncbi:MAG: hypothetical protein SVM80_07735 [Halobacteriota archaeon]|nr:hypothetical protein [Halobacteriota archaeon]